MKPNAIRLVALNDTPQMTRIFDRGAYFLIRVWTCLSGTPIHVIKAVQAQPRHVYFSTTNALYSIVAVNIAITILKTVEQLQC